jgi:presenilin 1
MQAVEERRIEEEVGFRCCHVFMLCAEGSSWPQQRQLDLKYGAHQVIALIIPVSVCMITVIVVIQAVSYYSQSGQTFAYAPLDLPLTRRYTPYNEQNSSSSGATFGGALLNVVIILGIVVGMTIVLLVLYKYRLYKVCKLAPSR